MVRSGADQSANLRRLRGVPDGVYRPRSAVERRQPDCRRVGLTQHVARQPRQRRDGARSNRARGTPDKEGENAMYINDYVVGAFFGALITGFLTIAALTRSEERRVGKEGGAACAGEQAEESVDED